MSSALSKDGKYLLVLNGGYNPPSITVLQADTMQEVGRTPVADGWLGLTFSPDGKSVYVGGGSRRASSNSRGTTASCNSCADVRDRAGGKAHGEDFIGDVVISPDGRMVYAAGLYHDAVHVVNLQSGRVIERFATGRRPYRILFHPDGKSYFVSSWADGSVYHHDALTGNRLGLIRLGAHTTDMIWRARKPEEIGRRSRLEIQWGRMFVTASNTNCLRGRRHGEQGSPADRIDQHRAYGSTARGHDAERAGDERRPVAAICRVLGCECRGCGRRGGCR
jgi:WD40 repeat protein